MSGEPLASAIAIAAAAHRLSLIPAAKHTEATQTRLAAERELETDEGKRARLIQLEDEDAALRHLDGEESVPSKPQRVKALAALQTKIPRLKAAIPLAKRREAEALQEVAAAQAPFTGAVMEAVCMIQAPAAERLRSLVAEMEGSLRDLLIADLIRLGTIGDRFSVPNGQRVPFNGSSIVRKLVAALPPRLLPQGLTIERLEAQARAAATSAICTIKENR